LSVESFCDKTVVSIDNIEELKLNVEHAIFEVIRVAEDQMLIIKM